MKIDKQHKTFISDLIRSVHKREDVWSPLSEYYFHHTIVNEYWTEIAFKLKLRYKNEDITGEKCKTIWNQLVKVYWERKPHSSASTFEYGEQLAFLGVTRKVTRESGNYGMFDIKNAVNLLPIHAAVILASIVVFFIMDMYNCFVSADDISMNSSTMLFLMPFGIVCQSSPVGWLTPPTRSETKYATMAAQCCITILITSYFLLFTPTILITKDPNAFKVKHFALCYLCISQITAYWFHGFKLSRPILPIEHASHIVGMLTNAFSMLVFSSFSEWNVYYLFFPLVVILNACILACHAVVSTIEPDDYPYQNVFHYVARPESEDNPFSLVITVENKEKYSLLSDY